MVCCAHTTMPMRTHLLPFAGIALVAVTASCGRTEPAAWTVSVQRLASPAGPNSSEPQIVDSGRGRILSWVERVGTTSHLKFAERMGSGWSPAVTAASGNDWFLSYADVPSVMRLTDGTLVAQWLQQLDPITEAYQPAPFVFERQRQDVGAFVHAAQRWNQDAAWLCIAARDARQHARRRMARWTQQYSSISTNRTQGR